MRGLTCRFWASPFPLRAREGWLVMMAVTRSLRVGGLGVLGVSRSRRGRAVFRSRDGAQTVTSMAVMAVRGHWGGRRRG